MFELAFATVLGSAVIAVFDTVFDTLYAAIHSDGDEQACLSEMYQAQQAQNGGEQ